MKDFLGKNIVVIGHIGIGDTCLASAIAELNMLHSQKVVVVSPNEAKNFALQMREPMMITAPPILEIPTITYVEKPFSEPKNYINGKRKYRRKY
jgi:hypothetical protein